MLVAQWDENGTIHVSGTISPAEYGPLHDAKPFERGGQVIQGSPLRSFRQVIQARRGQPFDGKLAGYASLTVQGIARSFATPEEAAAKRAATATARVTASVDSMPEAEAREVMARLQQRLNPAQKR